jgi:hypothetical protein
MITRATVVALLLGLALVTTAGAQDAPEVDPEDQDTAGAELLRNEIERRFAARVQSDLGLSNDQMTKLKTTQEKFGPRRRQLIREFLGYELALRGQMRPGVAANADSVRVYMDGKQRVRAAQLALEQEEDREMAAYLSPVQRAQFQMMRQNLLRRANELRELRRGRGLGGRRPIIQRPPPRALPQPRRRP